MAEASNSTKRCSMCRAEKPVSEFYLFRGKPVAKCKPCICERVKSYRIANPEVIATRKKRYYEDNKSEVLAKQKAYWHSIPPEIRAAKKRAYYQALGPGFWKRRYWEKIDYIRPYMKAWNEANRDMVNAQQRIRWAAAAKANPGKHAAYIRRWRAENPEATAAQANKRRALERGGTGRYDRADVVRIRHWQRDRCAVCGLRLRGRGVVDHIKPLSRGGDNVPRNLQILCAPCNQSKWAFDPIDFMRRRGRLI